MTAPVFLFTSETIEPADAVASATAGSILMLTGPEARHAVTVKRLRSQERVDLVDGAGLRLVCEVTGAGVGGAKDRLAVRVLERIEEPAPPLRLTLVQALAKGGRDEQAVETATEVGAELVLPWQAERCVSVWQGAKRAKGRQRWQATALQAAKQSRRVRVPEVEAVRDTRALVDWVGQTGRAGGVVLVLHEEARTPISTAMESVRLPASGAAPLVMAVVVGPEGGITPEETAALEAAGATTVRLGPHVMRTASAGPVALAVLAHSSGLWE
ncbi:16S rRNA (uracil(1498)-N(3))-methyltransferase [Actinomyces viscosus]|uniref:16S rRNA (uracil(1498)-N(3))-methyltransferase n=1 Tax=Actinomyces viscosus TaxID=1656 RepID=UPI0028EC5CDC|nr:16S rRNA (uracil(1498)-N(3))-methyltransferase [Actinomyces viscosus]